MSSSIAAITTGTGGVITTADNSGNLNLVSGTTTIVAVTSAGATVTGTLSSTGNISTGNGSVFGWGSFSAYVGGSSATNMVNILTNSTERMRIDSSGNVGIGTTSPSSKLTVGDNPPTAGAIAGVCASGGISLALSDNVNNSLYVKHVAAGVATFGTDNGGQIAFATNGFTEAMRINSSGSIFMGQTTNPATGTMVLKVPTGTGNGINAQITSNTGTSYPFSNYNASSAYVGGISCTSSATSFPTSSDKRLKKNIVEAPSAMGKILSAQVVSHDWINDEAHVDYGFVAQDLQPIIPSAVIEGTDNEDGTINMAWGVDYSKVVPILVKAIQELKGIIDTQAAQIDTQAAQITALNAKVGM